MTNGINKQTLQIGGGGSAVDSVNSQTGVVVLDTGDVASVTNSRYVTDAQLVVIGNTSGVNTGDQVAYSTEIDFGSGVPVRSKRFTITNAGVNSSSRIFVTGSSDTATGRVGNDWEWDSINFTAKAGTGGFTLTSNASGRVKGKRKIYYSFY